MYIFEITPLSVYLFAIIFSQSEGYLFTLLIVSFVVQKLLSLIRSHLFIFVFISNILGGHHLFSIWIPNPPGDLEFLFLASSKELAKHIFHLFRIKVSESWLL